MTRAASLFFATVAIGVAAPEPIVKIDPTFQLARGPVRPVEIGSHSCGAAIGFGQDVAVLALPVDSMACKRLAELHAKKIRLVAIVEP